MKRLMVILTTLLVAALSSAQSLPSGVTLQDIDGGLGYYGAHGFTYAHTAGWDDSTFFPIGPWLAPIQTQSDINRWKDLGLNTAFALTGNSNLSLLRSNGLWAVIQFNEYTSFGHLGAEVVGMLSCDECEYVNSVTTPLSTAPDSIQGNRFWYFNNTWNFIEYGDISGIPAPQVLSNLITTPSGTQRHIDIQSVDIYWMSYAIAGAKYQGGLIYNLGRDMTNDEARRSAHYGDMVDKIRAYQTTYPAPVCQIIENGGPMNEDVTAASYITPPEMNAAVWSSIIHGARQIMYFNHSFAGPAMSQDNFATSYYQTIQSGQTISIYNQAKATNALVKLLAPVINSPFARGYVTASPAASTLAGFDVMAKYYRNSQFYIFAMPRYSGSTTNQTATFTIKNTGATSVTVINESRTIPITNDTTFTDVFATGNTVHIYQVNGGSGIGRTSSALSGLMAARLQLGSNPWQAGCPLAINVTLGSKAFTRLAVYDLHGALVHSLATQMLSAGKHTFSWDGQNEHGATVSRGLYLVKLTTGNTTTTAKIVME